MKENITNTVMEVICELTVLAIIIGAVWWLASSVSSFQHKREVEAGRVLIQHPEYDLDKAFAEGDKRLVEKSDKRQELIDLAKKEDGK